MASYVDPDGNIWEEASYGEWMGAMRDRKIEMDELRDRVRKRLMELNISEVPITYDPVFGGYEVIMSLETLADILGVE